MNEHSSSIKREYSCHGCGQQIKFDSNITSPKSGKVIPLNMNGEQHDCPNFNNRSNYNQDQQSKFSVSTLTLEQAKYMDSVGPTVAQILELSQEIKDIVRKLVDRFDNDDKSAQ